MEQVHLVTMQMGKMVAEVLSLGFPLERPPWANKPREEQDEPRPQKAPVALEALKDSIKEPPQGSERVSMVKETRVNTVRIWWAMNRGMPKMRGC